MMLNNFEGPDRFGDLINKDTPLYLK